MKWKLPTNKVYRYILLIGLILFLVLFGISIAKSFFDSSSVGTVKQSVTSTTNKLGLLEFEGQNFSFSYPNYFQAIQTSPATGSDIEKYSFVTTQTTTWDLNIKVTNLTQASLDYDGSYNLRKTNPQTYTEETVTLGTNTAHIMTSGEGGFNKVAFLINGKMDASILLISSSSTDSSRMDIVLKGIIASWKWL